MVQAVAADGGNGAEATTEKKAFLGIRIASAAPGQTGLVINHVVPGTTAERMKVIPGDVLLSVNGMAINARTDLRQALDGLKVGQDISIEVTRQGKKQVLTGKMLPMPTPGAVHERMGDLLQQQRDKQGALLDHQMAQLELAEAMNDLSEILADLPEQLDTVAKEWKQIYPKGEFTVKVQINISTGPGDEGTKVDISPKQRPGPPPKE